MSLKILFKSFINNFKGVDTNEQNSIINKEVHEVCLSGFQESKTLTENDVLINEECNNILVCYDDEIETDEDGEFLDNSNYTKINDGDFHLFIDLNKEFVILSKNENNNYYKKKNYNTRKFKFVKYNKKEKIYEVIDAKNLNLCIYDSFDNDITEYLFKIEEEGNIIFDIFPNGYVHMFKFMDGILVEHAETLFSCEFELK